MSITKTEIMDLPEFLALHDGVANTFPQAGAPMPGEKGPSLLAQRCEADGGVMPVANNEHKIGTLVASGPSLRLGGMGS